MAVEGTGTMMVQQQTERVERSAADEVRALRTTVIRAAAALAVMMLWLGWALISAVQSLD